MNFSLYAGEKLAGTLSDEDIGGVLTCFMALPLRTREGEPCNTIREVELAHCSNVRGCGLEPLRGYAHLEKLDLSIVRWGEQSVTETGLDETVVLPILESIVDAKGCSLGAIQFPKIWRIEQSDTLRRFLEKCNEEMNRHKITCEQRPREYGAPKCGRLCRGTAKQPWFSLDGDDFATQNFTCSDCRKSFCQDCVDDSFLNLLCQRCDKKYCFGCFSIVLTCRQCEETTCMSCTGIDVCNSCEKVTCSECDPIMYCESCEESNCLGCVAQVRCEYPQCELTICENCEGDLDAPRRCLDCNVTYCPEHLLQMHFERGVHVYCEECNNTASYSLSENNEQLYEWVKMLEKKYGDEEYADLDLGGGASNDYLEKLRARDRVRDQLKQRCRAIGAKMSLERRSRSVLMRWLIGRSASGGRIEQ